VHTPVAFLVLLESSLQRGVQWLCFVESLEEHLFLFSITNEEMLLSLAKTFKAQVQ